MRGNENMVQGKDKLNLDNDEFLIRNGELIKVKKINKKILIPEGVEIISVYAFQPSFKNWDDDKRILSIIEEIKFPSTLKHINGPFYCDLREVILPYGLETICANAFSRNSNLEIVELYDQIKEIDMLAFALDRVAKNNLAVDSEIYVTKVPKKFIIHYTSYASLVNVIDNLIQGDNFKFKIFRVPELELVLIGPELSKIEYLQIYRKLILTRCKNINFINYKEMAELPNYIGEDSDLNMKKVRR